MRKLKVGIITMHRVVNYGSFLQAYATQKIIENLGHDCEIIDYVFPNKWHYEHGLKKNKQIKSMLSKFLGSFLYYAQPTKQQKIMTSVNKHLKLSRTYKSPEEIHKNPPKYDVYCTGSDQTWNPKHMKGDSTFMLSFAPIHSRKISFSASLGCSNIDDKYKSIYKKYLSQYNSISIREANGLNLIKELSGKEATVTLDPTLLLNKKQWLEIVTKHNIFTKKNYILFYPMYHSFDPRPYIYELLKMLQDKTKYDVFTFERLPKNLNIKNVFVGNCDVDDFLQLFLNASFVVTNSFHGTAFALNFGIPLYSIIKKDNDPDDRQINLLKYLNIEHCAVPLEKNFNEIMPYYDIKNQQEKLSQLREISINYLNRALISN
ncbi:MAG TPA: polysaccharide pyruvyl transferase family protein [Gallicola sp.]|jgi:hypothetical protein|nr:polysaccharide pyruvyl transferase family protein [Gallicola sp.]